jgi:hypothetical protein
MLLNLITGAKPSKWMVTLLAFYMQGLASVNDVLNELERAEKKRSKPGSAGTRSKNRD